MAGNSAEWIRIPDGNGGLKKIWLRDSTARRDIATLNTSVSGKQDALSTAQLNAVNSGITAAKVATYDAIDVPTKTSELTNDSGYITSSDIPTIPTASTANPQMDGTASAGTSSSWSRGDHIHPSDTSKQDALSTAQLAAVNSGITAAKVSTYDSISVPTAVSELTNDSGYQTSADVSSAISAEAGLLIPYGYCSTAAETAAKVVTVSPTVTSLTAGLIIAVKFQYANTVASPTLNVNSLGAKSIKRYGTTAPSTSAASSWNANSVVLLTYDGTYWMLADWNNTTYSGMSDAEYQAGTGTSNRLITPARLKAAIELHAPVTSVNGSTGAVTVTVPTQTSDLSNDSGFITSSDIPTNVSAFNNDAGYLTSAPVTSVNSQTGAVTLDASDVGALPDSTAIPSKTSDLTNDSGYITSSSVPSASSTTPNMDGTAAVGSETKYARGDHVHPSDTSKQDTLSTAQLNAVNSGITAAKVSTYDAISVPTAYTSSPAMNGTASAGSSTSWSRGDHVHPTDTSRQAALSTAQMNAVNSGITAAKVTAYDAISVPNASSTTPAMDGSGAAGSSDDYARADHVHPSDTAKQDALSAAQLAACNSGITSSNLAVNDASVVGSITPIVPTLLNGAHHANYGGCYYYKVGYRVTVHIGVSGLTAKTKTSLWTLPTGYRPNVITVTNGIGQDTPYYSRLRVNTNGVVVAYSESTYALAELSYDVFT